MLASLFVFFLLGFMGSAAGQQCSQIGVQGSRSRSRRIQTEHLFLNTADPADCWGTISRFSFCYYAPSIHRNGDIYRTNFGVYRPSVIDGNIVYTLVSGVLTAERTQSQIDNELDYDDDEYEDSSECRTNINLAEPVTVAVGDVFGACVFDPPDNDIHRLDMVRTSTGSADVLKRAGTTGCSDVSIPLTVDTFEADVQGYMHLYATIEPLPETEPPPTTTMPPTTVAPTTQPTTEATTMATTEVTTMATTQATTMATTQATTIATTQVTTMATTQATTMATTQATTMATTEVHTMATTEATTMATTEPTTMATTEPTTMATTKLTTMATTEPTTMATTEVTTMARTEATTMATTLEVTTQAAATIDSEATTEATTDQNPLTFQTRAPTTEETTDSTTSGSATDSESVQQEGSGNLVSVVVPIVLVLLIAGAILGLVMLLAWSRYRKKTVRSVNIQRSGAIGFENMIYAKGTDYDNAVLYSAYDEVVTHTDLPSKDTKHIYEDDYEFPMAAPGEPSYDTMYAEVGPYEEAVLKESQYKSPLDAQGIRFSDLLEKNRERDIYDHISPYQVPATKERELYGQLKSWGTRSIPRNEIGITGHLGSGQFGSVEQGVWKRQGTKPVDVALKSLTKTSEEDKVKFLQEAAIMAQFRQSNVLQLHGVVIQGQPIMIVTELAARGTLKSYLQTSRPSPGELVSMNTPNLFLKFSQQVALGMQYLSAKGFVHRDLAARSILVTSDNICKISEFGMSRDLADEKYYVSQGGKIPVKWTAPEAIHYKKYSTASDVWSYGCLLYEIWSLGHKPFEGIQNVDVIQLIDSGKRLPPPPGCPKMIYELMNLCWHPRTVIRPSFRDVVLTLVGSEEIVLNIPEEDSSTNPLAGVLGTPLEAGENMYSELQRRYINYQQRAGEETDEDYFDIN